MTGHYLNQWCPRLFTHTLVTTYCVKPRKTSDKLLVNLNANAPSKKLYSKSLVIFTKIVLTHWGRVTHICVDKLTIIGSDNGLSPGRRQAITWTNVGILLIGPLGTNVSEILSGIQTFSFKKVHLKMSSAKWRPFCLGLSVLSQHCESWWPGTVRCRDIYILGEDRVHELALHFKNLPRTSNIVWWQIKLWIKSV